MTSSFLAEIPKVPKSSTPTPPNRIKPSDLRQECPVCGGYGFEGLAASIGKLWLGLLGLHDDPAGSARLRNHLSSRHSRAFFGCEVCHGRYTVPFKPKGRRAC
jgi:hypothetical protein